MCPVRSVTYVSGRSLRLGFIRSGALFCAQAEHGGEVADEVDVEPFVERNEADLVNEAAEDFGCLSAARRPIFA